MKIQILMLILSCLFIRLTVAEKPTPDQCAYWRTKLAELNQKSGDRKALIQEQKDKYHEIVQDVQNDLDKSLVLAKDEQKLVEWYKSQLNNDLAIAKNSKKYLEQQLDPKNADNILKDAKKERDYTVAGLENQLKSTQDPHQKQELLASIDHYQHLKDYELFEPAKNLLVQNLKDVNDEINSLTKKLHSNQLGSIARTEINKNIDQDKKAIEYYQELSNESDDELYNTAKNLISRDISALQEFLKQCK